jgi:hypothetical protein
MSVRRPWAQAVVEAARAVHALDTLIAEWNEIDATEVSKLNQHQAEAARMTAEELALRAKEAANALRMLNVTREDA